VGPWLSTLLVHAPRHDRPTCLFGSPKSANCRDRIPRAYALSNVRVLPSLILFSLPFHCLLLKSRHPPPCSVYTRLLVAVAARGAAGARVRNASGSYHARGHPHANQVRSLSFTLLLVAYNIHLQTLKHKHYAHLLDDASFGCMCACTDFQRQEQRHERRIDIYVCTYIYMYTYT